MMPQAVAGLRVKAVPCEQHRDFLAHLVGRIDRACLRDEQSVKDFDVADERSDLACVPTHGS